MINKLEELFLSLGYTNYEYRFIRNYGILIIYSDKAIYDNLIDDYNFFAKLGYDHENILKTIKYNPSILSLNSNKIEERINNFIDFGYTRQEVLKMLKNTSHIIMLDYSEIFRRINDLIVIGYTREDIFKMTKSTPALYSMRLMDIKEKITYIMELDYSKEEVLYMTKMLPNIFLYSNQNIKDKIDFFNLINKHHIPFKKPNLLIQGSNLSFARLEFFLENDISIDNYKKIFLSEKQFEKQYNLSNEEVLDGYKFNKFQEKKLINYMKRK